MPSSLVDPGVVSQPVFMVGRSRVTDLIIFHRFRQVRRHFRRPQCALYQL